MMATLRQHPSAIAAANPETHPSPITPADRRTRGKRLRDAVPRDAHAAWRAHAGREDPISILRAADRTREAELVISGYLGKGNDFDEAMGKWALAYADQAEQDHAALKAAVRAGIIDVELEQ
jgi:hypothetical protein